MKIAVGADHAGFQLKESVREILGARGIEVVDYGTFDETSVDYPDIARPLAEDVVAGKADVGVLICSNGVGMSITANKVRGARAALCHDTFDAMRAREHNNANIVCMGGWCIGKGVAEQILDAYLGATFGGGRHERRVGKIMAIEAAIEAALDSEREAAGR